MTNRSTGLNCSIVCWLIFPKLMLVLVLLRCTCLCTLLFHSLSYFANPQHLSFMILWHNTHRCCPLLFDVEATSENSSSGSRRRSGAAQAARRAQMQQIKRCLAVCLEPASGPEVPLPLHRFKKAVFMSILSTFILVVSHYLSLISRFRLVFDPNFPFFHAISIWVKTTFEIINKWNSSIKWNRRVCQIVQ